MPLTYTERTALTTEECCVCGVMFAMPDSLRTQRVDDKKPFYCPNGHGQNFLGKTDAERERERAERLAQQLASREEDLRAERMSHRATKAQLTKTRKRVGNGVCPCCNRTFANVTRHMASQHPDYKNGE